MIHRGEAHKYFFEESGPSQDEACDCKMSLDRGNNLAACARSDMRTQACYRAHKDFLDYSTGELGGVVNYWQYATIDSPFVFLFRGAK